MSETRNCDQCGKRLISQRRGARFCNEYCKSAWHNEDRRRQTATNKRLTPVDGGVGARGGNVRSVSEARDLQSASKELDRWRLVMEQQVFRTLVSTGYFHVDDLDCLDLPPAAFEVRGTLVNRVRAKGWMERSGAERKVAHKAANARKAPIYRISAKGRAELPGLIEERNRNVGASADLPEPKGKGRLEEQGEEGSACSGEAGPSLAGGGAGAQGGLTGTPARVAGTASPEQTPTGAGGERTEHERRSDSSETSSCSGGKPASMSPGLERGQGGEPQTPSPASVAEGSSELPNGFSASEEPPPRLPGFEESAAARNLKDAA